MNLRDIIIKENETLLSTEGQQPHNFAAKSQVGQGIEWPKAAGSGTVPKQERDEVEMPGEHHVTHHGDDSHHGGDGVSESVVNEAGGNYLYHSTEDAATAKAILQSGVFKAGNSSQTATDAQVGETPTISFGRNLAYQINGSNVGRDYQVVFVVNRGALESKYKTIGTSQSGDIRGLGHGSGIHSAKLQNQNPFVRRQAANKTTANRGMVDANKDGKFSQDEIKANPDLYRTYVSPKAGGEFEEVVPTKTGTIPWRNMLVGFYLVPGKAAAKDPELLNHPLRLEMPRPNNFVKANVSAPAESYVKEFAPAGGGTPPKGPKIPGRDPWGGNDGGEDPYKYPQPEHYSRSIEFFGRFEADHFDDEVFDQATGEFRGYWDDQEGRDQIAYFKFDNPKRTGDDDPGMGWYYEPQSDSSESTSATPSAFDADERKKHELGMINAFLKSGKNPSPGSPIYALMKRYGFIESVVNEFAPSDSGDNNEEDVLHKYARMWYNGDDATQQQVEQILDRMGWEIGELESEEGGAFVVQAGDENGDSYIGFTANDLTESWVMEDGEATSVVSADIAQVVYPMTRGRTLKQKRKNARAAVGQKYVPGPAGIGQGVFESAFDNYSPMGKESVKRDRIRSLKNLIAVYQEKGDKTKVRELKKELELLVIERLGEASLSTMRDYFAGQGDGFDPTKLSQMRKYFNSTGGNSGIPENIKRIIWKIKNNENLFPEEFQQYKVWQQNRQKTQEAHVLGNDSVIYRLDREKPMSDTEVLVLGGAGRYTLDGLRRKARREADELAQDLKIEHGGSFRRAAENIKQLTNTLNTIVAAYNELRRIRKKGGRGSRGITDEEANFIRECSDQMALLDHYAQTVKRAKRIAEGIQRYLKEDKMSHEQASIIKGMFHLNTDPGYGFYRYAIHVAGDHGGDKVVLGPNAGPFAYAYTDAEEEMIRNAVKAITGKEPIELTGGKSREPEFVNKNSTVPSIDWKKVK